MKNVYFGDLTDLAKFALLRALPSLRIGVVWYLTEPDGRTGDGRNIGYLTTGQHRELDPELFDRLREIVHRRRRHVKHAKPLLPDGTVFFDELVSTTDRAAWFQCALAATADCQFCFLDPDNGIAPLAKNSVKHATLTELQQIAERGQSLVVIQFFNRQASHHEQVEARLHQLRDALPSSSPPFAVWFRSSVSIAFLIVPALAHAVVLLKRVSAFVDSSQGVFTLALWPSSSP